MKKLNVMMAMVLTLTLLIACSSDDENVSNIGEQ